MSSDIGISVFRPVSPAGEMAGLTETTRVALPGILFEWPPARLRNYFISNKFLFE
jgi:hypothetical protein